LRELKLVVGVSGRASWPGGAAKKKMGIFFLSGSSGGLGRYFRKYPKFSDLDLVDEQHELGAEIRSRNRWIWRGIGGIGR
jgi:hypothetical protein